jgi:hypothetical protein
MKNRLGQGLERGGGRGQGWFAPRRDRQEHAFATQSPPPPPPQHHNFPAVVTAAQVAMLGGQWRPSTEAEVAEEDLPGPLAGRGKKGPSKAMPVAEFLAKGEGATMLPRSKQVGV